jgi:hypothetical protein
MTMGRLADKCKRAAFPSARPVPDYQLLKINQLATVVESHEQQRANSLLTIWLWREKHGKPRITARGMSQSIVSKWDLSLFSVFREQWHASCETAD